MRKTHRIAYRRRLLRRYQRYSPKFKDADLAAIADAATFGGIEAVVYADAAAASRTPDNLPEIGLVQRTRVDPVTGGKMIEFFGNHTFIREMARPSFCARINPKGA